jgi:hypothetical protein
MRARAASLASGLALARERLAVGENMIEALTSETRLTSLERIEIAYALQSGSYTQARDRPAAAAYRNEIQSRLSTWLTDHGCATVLDLGAGEGTAWHGWSTPLDQLTLLDLSLNRLRWAPDNVADAPVDTLRLVKGDMAAPPVAPAGVDAVVTMHAMEPNGPSAQALVQGASSCAARLLVLFEPDYASAHEAMRTRMDRHNYARDIFAAARALDGFTEVEAGRLDHPVNPDNATSFIALARSGASAASAASGLADPLRRQPLTPVSGGLRDAAGDFIYPVLEGVACLSPDDGVLLGQS